MYKKLFFIILLFSFLGCQSTLGSKADLQKVNFEIGKTSKQEVSNAIGLPDTIKKTEDGNEYWYYNEAPQNIVINVPVLSIGGLTTASIHVNTTDPLAENADAIFVFNSKGLLLKVKKRNE